LVRIKSIDKFNKSSAGELNKNRIPFYVTIFGLHRDKTVLKIE